MQPIINHLVQLQELIIARAQQEAGMPGAQLDQLDASLTALTKELPANVNLSSPACCRRDPPIVPVAASVLPAA